MTEFLLMRHGEADFTSPREWETRGWGADLAPLSPRGIEQVRGKRALLSDFAPQLILASPMTRALQSAAIAAHGLNMDVTVEFELHEWVPDLSFQWQTLDEVLEYQNDFLACKGEWPEGERRCWEPLSSIRSRAAAVLVRYSQFQRVLVVCHGMVMYSLTGIWEIENAQCLPYSVDR